MQRSPPWTRLIRFVAVEDSAEHYGQPIDDDLDVGLALHKRCIVRAFVVTASSAVDPNARLTSQVLTVAKLLSPIQRSSIGAVLAIGLNYTDHAAEMGFAVPTVPTTFLKARTTVTDPNSVISVPKAALDHIDYEVELAVIISKDCRDVSPENALDYVLGYTLANDLTSRNHQSLTTQWSHSKSFDAFCPLGPCIVSSNLIPDPSNISLSTRLQQQQSQSPSQPLQPRQPHHRLHPHQQPQPHRHQQPQQPQEGEEDSHSHTLLLQNGNTRDWIFTLPHAISYLSRGMTLERGTVLLTGTPAGIGAGRSPPVWLRDGDVTMLRGGNGIGTLVNSFSFESARKMTMTNGVH